MDFVPPCGQKVRREADELLQGFGGLLIFDRCKWILIRLN